MTTFTAVGRSGSVVSQPLGYGTFVPSALPPNPAIEFDDELASLLADASVALGRLDGTTSTLPNPDLFVFVYVRKEAVLSSQIEGTQSSLADLLEAESAIRNPDHPDDIDEVSHYVGALNYGIEQLEKRNLTLSMLQELHRHLMEGQNIGDQIPGQLRNIQNWIGRKGSTINDAVYVPPPPGDVPRLLEELEGFLTKRDDVPDLIKIGLAHAQFESIHPFIDGNGRVGRLMVSLLLKQYGLLKYPLLYLSAYFKLNRTEYYSRLQNTRDRGDWEGWLKFFLRGVVEVGAESSATARSVLVLRESHRENLRVNMGKGAASALELLDTLYYRPFVTVQSAGDIVGLTFAAANRLVARLVELEILVPTAEKARNRAFCYRPFLDLFEQRSS